MVLPMLAAVPAVVAAAPLPASVHGVVRDARTGAPVASALVEQGGAVASVLTGRDGSFRLLLDPNGGSTVQVTASGYDVATVAIGRGAALVIKLVPAAIAIPEAPSTPAALEGAAAPEAPLPPGRLASEVFASYRLRGEWLAAGNASQTGFANNDYALGGRVRWHDWLAELEGSHDQVPINVADLPREENPAFSPSTWEVGLRLGKVWDWRPDVEVAAGGGYRWIDTVPNNKGIPYTSSGLDFEQARHAVGAFGLAAWHPAAPWSLEGGLGAYPVVSAWAQDPGKPIASTVMLDGRVEAIYDLMPGLRVGLGYQVETWLGNGADTYQLLGIRLHYRPAGL